MRKQDALAVDACTVDWDNLIKQQRPDNTLEVDVPLMYGGVLVGKLQFTIFPEEYDDEDRLAEVIDLLCVYDGKPEWADCNLAHNISNASLTNGPVEALNAHVGVEEQGCGRMDKETQAKLLENINKMLDIIKQAVNNGEIPASVLQPKPKGGLVRVQVDIPNEVAVRTINAMMAMDGMDRNTFFFMLFDLGLTEIEQGRIYR